MKQVGSVVPPSVLIEVGLSGTACVEALSANVFKATCGNHSCVIKRTPSNENLEVSLWQRELYRLLSESAFECFAKPVPDFNGASGWLVDGFVWSAFEYIEGDPAIDWRTGVWSASHIKGIARAMAELHRIDADLQGVSAPGSRANLQSLLPRTQLSARLSSIATLIEPDHSKASLLAFTLQARLEECFHMIEDLEYRMEMLRRAGVGDKFFNPSLIHGDLHIGNAIFANSRLVSLVDFDFARIDFPIFDLGYALFMLCFWRGVGFSLADTTSGEKRASLSAISLTDSAVDLVEVYFGEMGSDISRLSCSAVLDELAPFVVFSAFLVLFWEADLFETRPDSEGQSAGFYASPRIEVLRGCCDFITSWTSDES